MKPLTILITASILAGLIGCAGAPFRRVVPQAPFYQWVKEALREEGIKRPEDRIEGSRGKALRPDEPGMMYSSYCPEIIVYGIRDSASMDRIEASVRHKAKGQLHHKAILTFSETPVEVQIGPQTWSRRAKELRKVRLP